MSTTAETLLANNDYRKLEHLFASTLKTSTDTNLFRIYINYLHRSEKTPNLVDVYEFVLKRLKHHWDVYPYIQKYVSIVRSDILLSEDEKIDKIRCTYHTFFHTPMNHFNSLWKDYECFENELNRNTAKSFVGEVLPVYQKTFRLYLLYKNMFEFGCGEVQDLVTMESFYDVVELEERNVCGFESKHFEERLDFVFRFFCERYEREEVYFLWAEFLIKQGKKDEASRVTLRGITSLDDNLFLTAYHSTIGDEERLSQALDKIKGENDLKSEGEQNDKFDLLLINLLSFTLKNLGFEKFREIVKKYIGLKIGPADLIFIAKTEYFTSQNKDLSFKIFTRGLVKYPEDLRLQEEFVSFLIQTGDTLNARAFFDRFVKTERLCKMMMELEMRMGSNERFREIVQLETANQVQNVKVQTPKWKEKEKYYLSFKESLCYQGLDFEDVTVLDKFLSDIKIFDENCCYKITSDLVIETLQSCVNLT